MSSGGAKETCSTGLYTHSGECCKACNLGEGVAQPCGANQTVCEPCLDSESITVANGAGGRFSMRRTELGSVLPSGRSPANLCVVTRSEWDIMKSRERLN